MYQFLHHIIYLEGINQHLWLLSVYTNFKKCRFYNRLNFSKWHFLHILEVYCHIDWDLFGFFYHNLIWLKKEERCVVEYNYKSSFFITHHGSSEFWLLTTFHFCLCCCFPSWQLNISVSTAQISIVCVLVKVSFLFFPRRIISLKITQIFHWSHKELQYNYFILRNFEKKNFF